MVIDRLLGDSKNKEILVRAGAYLSVTGLFVMDYFNALSNYGIILLTLLGLVEFFYKKDSVKNFFTSPQFTPFILLFFMFMGSLLYTNSENLNEIHKYAEKRLLFLVLPLALIAFPSFNKKIYREIFWLFFLLVFFTAIPSTIYYLINREVILTNYQSSGVLPTVVNHVRYSLMVCYAITIGIYLVTRNEGPIQLWKRILLISGIIFLVFFNHLLAVRSGLISFYTIIIIFLIYLLLKKNYLYSFILFAGIGIMALLSFQYLDTLKAKVGYTIYDLKQSSIKESANNYSLSRRILANKIALQLFLQNPILGTGEANLRSEMNKIYKEEHPYILKENYLSPHNQFLNILASTGIIGFLFFLTCFYFPLFYRKNFRHLPLVSMYVILTISFIAEDTLQTQLGYMFGLFFIMINLHALKEAKDEKSLVKPVLNA